MYLIGTGTYLPPSRPNNDGGAAVPDSQWANRCVALPDDHPANMASRALSTALSACGVSAQELALVVYCGRARDHLAGWSVSAEVMREAGTAAPCVGLDVMMGCATLPAALEIARGWLAVPGRRYAAIVDAERWDEAIDRTNPENQRLWAYGDGAAALIVSSEPHAGTPSAEYLGATFKSHPGYNSFFMPAYGGTRRPHAERPEHQLALTLDGSSAVDVFGTYCQLYEAALGELNQHPTFAPPDHIVCSQLSPAWVTRMVPRFHKPRPKSVLTTGNETGHVGGVDLILGIDALLRRDDRRGHALIAGTSPVVTALALLRVS